MNRQRYELVITLKSDLCAGSGYSYAGIIDSDACYDEWGLPYIPAKRLKGCLREAAELIGLDDEKTGRLFGNSGQDASKGLFLDNAYIEGYSEIRRALVSAAESELKEVVTAQNILEQFTTVKAQTKIDENGTAKDNALRFTRTVNRYSPIGIREKGREKELCFIADVSFTDVEKTEIEEDFEKVVKAVRNIGMNRNRGLGSVKCELKPAEDVPDMHIDDSVIEREDDRYILKYTVRNVSPLILSTNNDFKTEKYIGGRSVLGYFAGAYLASGKRADTEEFAELFLKNKVIYSALYPSVAADKDRPDEQDVYYPAPFYISRLKKSKKYVNISKEIPDSIESARAQGLDETYLSGNGNQARKLKEKFVCIKDGKLLVREPETDIVYHHTKKSQKQDSEDGSLLYITETLREQQLFTGEITGSGKAVKTLAGLLESGKLRFGKSKTSQYGTCMLEGCPVIKKAVRKETVYPAGSRILVVLRSDAVFMGKMGYTVRGGQIREQIKNRLGIVEMPETKGETDEKPYTDIEAGVVNGYYAKWNLKRPAVPVIRAGSTFEYWLAEDLVLEDDPIFLGECTGEGFGRADILYNGKKKGECCKIEEPTEENKKEDKKNAEKLASVPSISGEAAELILEILISEAKESLRKEAVKINSGFPNPAALGRITLMLTESMKLFPESPENRYMDFKERVSSIKTSEVQEKGLEILKNQIGEEEDVAAGNLKYMKAVEDIGKLQAKSRLLGEDAGEWFDRLMKDYWSDYLMAVLVQEKYNLKQGESGNEKDKKILSD